MLEFQILLSLILGITFIFSFIIDYTHVTMQMKNKMFYCLSIVLFIFTAIRIRGWDFENYRNIYSTLPEDVNAIVNYYPHLEIGFKYILLIFKECGASYRIIVVFFAFITLLLLINFIEYYTEKKLATLSIFYFLYFIRGPYGQLRQALAMCMLLYAFKFLINNEKYKFLVINAMAYLIHSVSIAYVIVYIFCKKHYKSSLLYFFIIISIILSCFSKDLINLLLIFNIDMAFFEKLRLYHLVNITERHGVTLDMVRYIVVSIIFINQRKMLNVLDKKNNLAINIYVLGTIIFNILGDNLRIASRVSRLFVIFEIVLLPQLIMITHNYYKKMLIIFIILSFLIYKITIEFLFLKNGVINYYL